MQLPPLIITDKPRNIVSIFPTLQERDSRQWLAGERPEGDLPVVSPAWTAELGAQQQQLDLQLTLCILPQGFISVIIRCIAVSSIGVVASYLCKLD